jgi:hypothetical protein
MAHQQGMNHPPQQGSELPALIRNYVHYGKMAEIYGKQATGARKLRDEFESKVIHTLRENHMENAIIQITGAQLQCVEQKSMPPLSMPRLEQYLHKYYAQKGTGVDETESILRFLKLQKQNDAQSVMSLKKTVLPAAIPPPPPLPPLQASQLLGQNNLK